MIRQMKSRRMKWAGHVARMGEEGKVYKVLVGKPEEERPLGRPRRRWEDGVRMDLRETGLGSVEWIRLAYGSMAFDQLVSFIPCSCSVILSHNPGISSRTQNRFI
jgi:hypothetical protein